MKRLAVIFFALAAMLLCGCEAGEVQRRIVVHALGIDPLGDGYEVSYQVFSGGTSSEQGGPVDASESTVITLLAQGRTLYETEESLRLQTGKEVFMGDVELIVLSDGLKDADITEFLRYFRRADVYLGVNVVFCRGSAGELIGQKLNQGSATAILLKGVVETAIDRGRACSSRIIEISNSLGGGSSAAAIPVLSLEKEGGESEDSTVSDVTLGVFGSLLITKDGFAGEIGEDEAMGIRLLRGDVKELSVEVGTEKGIAALELKNMKIKRRISLENGAPFLNIRIDGIYELRSSPDGLKESDAVNAAEKQLLELCADAFEALQKTRCDFIELGKLLEKYEPEYAEAQSEDFGRAIEELTVSVEASLKKY